jgi:hypothetical protein
MVPRSPPQEDLRQEDTSHGIRVPCPDRRTPASIRSDPELISPERREQLEKLGAAVSSDLVAALLVKRDLANLCRCKARKTEGVKP